LDHVASLPLADGRDEHDARPRKRGLRARGRHRHERGNISAHPELSALALEMESRTNTTAHRTCTCTAPPMPRQITIGTPRYRSILVVVCEKETGKLIASMKCNRPLVNRVIVITSPDDEKTNKYCRDTGIECHATDALHRGGDSFNKGRALKEVQQKLHADTSNINSVILLVDADICLPPNMWSAWPAEIKKNTLYSTVSRCMYPSPRAFTSGWPALQGQWLKKTLGMYQAYAWSKNAALYSDKFPTASLSDYKFVGHFREVETLPMYVSHMGISMDNGRDWSGYKGNADRWAYSSPPPFGACPCCEFNPE